MREREKRRGLCVSGRMGAKWCSGTREVGATAGQRRVWLQQSLASRSRSGSVSTEARAAHFLDDIRIVPALGTPHVDLEAMDTTFFFFS